MNKFFSVTDFHRSVQAYLKRQFRGALIVFLVVGLTYGTLFIGVSECNALRDKLDPTDETPTQTLEPTIPPPPTDTPTITPTETLVPTNTPITPSDTPITPSDTPITPSDTPVPTDTPTVIPSETARPGGPSGPTDTPRPTKIIRPRNTAVITGTAGATATQTMIGGAAAGSITPESSLTLSPSPTIANISIGPITVIPLPPPVTNAVNRTYLLLLALLGIGGGSVSVNRLWSIRENNGSSHAGGGSAVPTTAINPTTVGALGFAAWLAGRVPVLTPDEKEVLAKVENGIGSAANQVGGTSDLNQISETGTEEFLQLTKSSPFLS